jgi:ribosomal protein S1
MHPGGGTHVMGTVAALDAQHVVVKAKDGKTTSVLVNEKTTYRKGAAAATSADLKVGDRVVVHTTGKGDSLAVLRRQIGLSYVTICKSRKKDRELSHI